MKAVYGAKFGKNVVHHHTTRTQQSMAENNISERISADTTSKQKQIAQRSTGYIKSCDKQIKHYLTL